MFYNNIDCAEVPVVFRNSITPRAVATRECYYKGNPDLLLSQMQQIKYMNVAWRVPVGGPCLPMRLISPVP